jgi:hypothetical protein
MRMEAHIACDHAGLTVGAMRMTMIGIFVDPGGLTGEVMVMVDILHTERLSPRGTAITLVPTCFAAGYGWYQCYNYGY